MEALSFQWRHATEERRTLMNVWGTKRVRTCCRLGSVLYFYTFCLVSGVVVFSCKSVMSHSEDRDRLSLIG